MAAWEKPLVEFLEERGRNMKSELGHGLEKADTIEQVLVQG